MEEELLSGELGCVPTRQPRQRREEGQAPVLPLGPQGLFSCVLTDSGASHSKALEDTFLSDALLWLSTGAFWLLHTWNHMPLKRLVTPRSWDGGGENLFL